MNLRKAVFAGSWYPGSHAACEKEIRRFEREFDSASMPARDPVGGIVPHAGWFFSGSIACNVIRRMAAGAPPELLLMFGMHLHPSSPCYMMPEGAWETPLGEVAVDEAVADALRREFPFELETPRSFLRDNTIELQMPFVRFYMPETRVLAMGVPPGESALSIGRRAVEIARALGRTVQALGSTDLTHYGPNYGHTDHGTGPGAVAWVRDENDRRVIDAMMALDARGVIREGLSRQNACCAGAAAAAIEASVQLGAESTDMLAYATSYDKNQDDSFVGYVGIVM